MTSAPITLIVVSYCHEAYIGDLFDSIEKQIVQPSLIVACDDASLDESASVLRSRVERLGIPYKLILNRHNRGLTATLNQALELVETPYFAYISGDDVMRPERMERQLGAFDADPDLAFVYSDAGRIDENGRRLAGGFIERHLGRERLETDDAFAALLEINWIPAPSVLARTECVNSVGGYDEDLFFEDYDLWLRLSRQYRFTGISEKLVDFRELSSSLGHTKFRDDDLDWQWSKVAIRAKHFNISPELDSEIGRLIKPWLITLASRGPYLDRLAPYFDAVAKAEPTIVNRVYATLSKVAPYALRIVCRSRRAHASSRLAPRRRAGSQLPAHQA